MINSSGCSLKMKLNSTKNIYYSHTLPFNPCRVVETSVLFPRAKPGVIHIKAQRAFSSTLKH